VKGGRKKEEIESEGEEVLGRLGWCMRERLEGGVKESE
jgi:hypothetical protein